METFKGTPGPWQCEKSEYSSYPEFHIQTEDRRHKNTFIGQIGGGLQNGSEVKYNALLAAAAPELLEIVEYVVSTHVLYPDHHRKAERLLNKILNL